MPRTHFKTISRADGRMDIFEQEQDDIAFERILGETVELRLLRVCSYCLMPNHWHRALWTERNGDLAAFM